MSQLSDRARMFLDNCSEELIKLTAALCAIPAPSHHEEQRAVFCLQWLHEHGCKEAYIDSAKNVLWPYRCDGKNRITCVAAHTDTVFPDTDPFRMEIRDNRAYCPAVGDDTMSVAQLMLIMEYVAKHQPDCPDGMLFALNSCEEGLGNLDGTKQLFADWSGRIASFISLDGSYKKIVAKAVGSVRYRIRIETEGGHSYGAFGNRNAIERMARLVSLLYDIEIPKIPGVKATYNVGSISGGTSVNTIAQSCEILYEYRSDAREGLSAMKRRFSEVIEQVRPFCGDLTVEVLGERPCSGSVNLGALKSLTDRAADIIEAHTGERSPITSGSTDCNWPLSLGIPAICIGGYLGAGAHTREEYVDLSSLSTGYPIVMEFIMSYFKEN
ncbi:MAG: M20/M25/M40 family metallo-hydrolase [Clostridia bacterium]|nr:M20/M25/M40 family metallo-hydrolase [Clostridia bacterium]